MVRGIRGGSFEMQAHLGEAKRALQKTLEVCRRMSREARGSQRTRILDSERQVRRALSLLQHLRDVNPRYDLDDPDLMPEKSSRKVKDG